MLVAFVVPATIVLILRVHGQNVESSEPNVVGVLEESVEFQWKVHRGFKNVTITGLNVYNGTGIVNFPNLFLFNGQLIKSPGVPERLNATIEGIVNDDIEVIYKIIMENVKYTDAGTTLYLNAVFEPLAQSGATVTLFTVKGRPEVCQGGFPSNFTFDDKSSPRINITLCGVPQPEVQAEFNGEKINVRSTTVNNYTHTFTLQLPLLTQQVCGEELTINASGYNGTLTNKTKIFLRDCPREPPAEPKSNTGAIAGGVIGGILFLILVGIAVFFFLRWKKSKSSGHRDESGKSLRLGSGSTYEPPQYADNNLAISRTESKEPPSAQTYMDIGPGGGRIGERANPPPPSHCREVKNEEDAPPKPKQGIMRQDSDGNTISDDVNV